MRVLVVGIGAIGSLFGATLARAGHEVLLVGRPEQVAAIRERGLTVEGTTHGTWHVPVSDEIERPLVAEAILLTVKSFDLGPAAESLGRSLPGPIPILLPQNGLGIEEIARTRLARSTSVTPPLVRAVNTIPAQLMRPGLVRHNGDGELRFADPARAGPEAPAIRLFFDLFHEAGVRTVYVPDLERALWTKAVVNGAINPVTAAYGVKNGALEDAPYRGIAEALLGEGIIAAQASGHALAPAEVEAELWRTVRATSENHSSMLQDVDRGRPTEIDAISGVLLATGRARGVRMAQTEEIIGRVRERARSRGQSS